MLPPPTTIANSAPASTASRTPWAVESRLPGSIPYPSSPARLSPESLRTTRLTGPSSESPAPSSSPVCLADPSTATPLELVVDEAPDHDVLAELLDGLLQQVPDRLVGFLDVGLRGERLLGDPLLHPALDDFLGDLLGLAHLRDLLLDHLPLFLEGAGRDVLRRDAHRPHGRDVQRHVAGELLELGRARHEVRLAVDLDEHADAPVEVHVGLDETLGRRPSTLFRGEGLASLPQDLAGALDVAVRPLQRALHVHHTGGSLLPELLDLLYRTSQCSYFSSVFSFVSSGATSSTGAGSSDSSSAAASGSTDSMSISVVSSGSAAASTSTASASAPPSATSAAGGSSVASTGGVSAAAAGAEGAGGASVWPFAVSASWTSPPTVASSITGGTGRSSARASSPRPSMIASATRRESRLIERIASSLPGMT